MEQQHAEYSGAGFLIEYARAHDDQSFEKVLGEAVRILEGTAVPYVLIGGVASTCFGRRRRTKDVDVFLRPEDVQTAFDAFGEQGFETEKTDSTWLFKAMKDGVVVDLIFRPTGGFYLDEEMIHRSTTVRFMGHQVRFISPEDLLILKVVAYDEASPRHWFDALSIIAATKLDWGSLLERARRAPRRILSLLTYAQALDIWVPRQVVRTLFERLEDQG